MRACIDSHGATEFFLELHSDLLHKLGDNATVYSLGTNSLPRFNPEDQPLLENMLDAVHGRGVFKRYKDEVGVFSELAKLWPVAIPQDKPTQKSAYNGFVAFERCTNLAQEMTQKLSTTLGTSLSNTLLVRADWFDTLTLVLKNCTVHVRMCVFKSLIGGWTTSVRMGETPTLPCIFGCRDERDDLRHYLACAPLWHIAGETLGCQPPLDIETRICMRNPTPLSARVLSLCFHSYHYAKSSLKNNPPEAPLFHSSAACQKMAAEAAKTFVQHLK